MYTLYIYTSSDHMHVNRKIFSLLVYKSSSTQCPQPTVFHLPFIIYTKYYWLAPSLLFTTPWYLNVMFLQIWRQMLNSGILPDSLNYNLLLRIARDCGIGDPALATSLLLRPVQKSESGNMSASERKNVIDIDLLERQLFIQADALSEPKQGNRGSEDESHSKEGVMQLTPVTQTAPVPVNVADGASLNLLDIFEDKVGDVISLGSVDKVSDRLALIGGAKGFLDKMEAGGLCPDLRTLTLLADMMEPGYTSLQMLLKVAKKHEIKLDVAFFNSAIHTAVRSGDPEGAKVQVS